MGAPSSKYAVPLADLVERAHVPTEDQVSSQPPTRPGVGARLDGAQLNPYGDGATAGDDD